jgi:hypothetical protein
MVMNPDEGIRKFGMGIRIPLRPPFFMDKYYLPGLKLAGIIK